MNKYALVRIPDEDSPKLHDFLDSYISHASSYKTLTTLTGNDKPTVSILKSFFNDNPRLSNIDTKAAENFFIYVKNRMAYSSLRTRIVTTRCIFKWGVDEGLLQKNPFRGLRLPPAKFTGRVLTDDEIAALFRNLPANIQRICKLSLYTGMRAREITSLDWYQVHEDYIIIPPEKSKSKREGTVFLHPNARKLLGPSGNGNVFMLTYGQLSTTIKVAWQSAGIGRVRFHDLRHTWATRYYEINHDFAALMNAGRWRSYGSALIYQHVSVDRQKEAANKLKYQF